MLWRMPEMVAPRPLVFQPLVKGNEALGTRLSRGKHTNHDATAPLCCIKQWSPVFGKTTACRAQGSDLRRHAGVEAGGF